MTSVRSGTARSRGSLPDINPDFFQHGTSWTNLNIPRNNQPIPPHALENPISVRIPFPLALQTVGLRNFVVHTQSDPCVDAS
eukprot:1187274-Prorocentrum_minimum.AAC.6